MKNPVELKRIFHPSGCLTREALNAYSRGECSSENTRQIEIHLSECPLCSDAVEAYMDLADNQHTDAILEETRQMLFGKETVRLTPLVATLPQKRKPNLRPLYYGIAATLLLLTVSYFTLRYIVVSVQSPKVSMTESDKIEETQKFETLEKNNEQADQQSGADKTVSGQGETVLPEVNGTIGGEQKKSEDRRGLNQMDFSGLQLNTDLNVNDKGYRNYPFPVNKDRDADMTEVPGTVGDEIVDVSDDKEAVNTGTISEESVMKSANTTRQNGTTGGNNRRNEKDSPAASKQEMTTGKSLEVQSEINDGVDAYNSGNYPVASEKLDQVLAGQPDQEQALYYSGMTSFYSADYKKALDAFGKILKNRNSSYYQAAQWQIAVIQLQLGEKRQARKTLNDVIDENGPYRQQAEQEIQKLEQE